MYFPHQKTLLLKSQIFSAPPQKFVPVLRLYKYILLPFNSSSHALIFLAGIRSEISHPYFCTCRLSLLLLVKLQIYPTAVAENKMCDFSITPDFGAFVLCSWRDSHVKRTELFLRSEQQEEQDLNISRRYFCKRPSVWVQKRSSERQHSMSTHGRHRSIISESC